MVEQQDAAGEPERVVPPEPAGADSTSAASAPSVPLAPPLGPPPPPPGAPLPPYASPAAYPQQPVPSAYPQPTAYPQTTAYPQHPGHPQQPAPGAYPLSSVSPPPVRSGSRNVALIVSLVAVGVVLTLAVLGIVLGFTIGSRSGADPAPVPSWSVPDATTAPSEEQPDDASDDEIDDGTATDPTGIADVLEAKIDEYKRLRESGELWQTIPDTEYNRTAVTAFLFFLTDMKVATIWGVDEPTAAEYEERMAMLEERLLAQEPLGDDVKITFEDGKVFTYDGETGEGGYTEG